ncbi:hypothetical protein EWS82_13160, partial [Staphylococcus xylosus]|nr:hypothetical protein [Staphylococcus xylosus]
MRPINIYETRVFWRLCDLVIWSMPFSRLKVGMDLKGLVGGLEYVLADIIANEKWAMLIGVWLEFYASRLKFEPAGRPDAIRLQQLENLSGLDKLFFSFEQYLSTEGIKAMRPINIYETRVFWRLCDLVIWSMP